MVGGGVGWDAHRHTRGVGGRGWGGTHTPGDGGVGGGVGHTQTHPGMGGEG